MFESQAGVADYTFSQEMPASKRQRRGSKKDAKYRKSSLPVAIRTRGTPDGYYEIPVRSLVKLYCNTSTGLWDTTQGTGAPIGTRGWRGFGISSTLDNTTFYLGENAVSAAIVSSVPGFTELQSVFDLCKIVDMKVQMWWTNQSSDLSTATSYGGFDLYIAEDPNNVDPPANLGTIMQYQKVKRYPGDNGTMMNYTIKPHVRVSAGADDGEAGTATTLGAVMPSTYIQTAKPGVSHLGFRGWVDVPQSATARTSTLNVLITQTRRYKMSR